MNIPVVGSEVRVQLRDSFGDRMIPRRNQPRVFSGRVLASAKWLSPSEFMMSGDQNFPVRVINVQSIEKLEIVSGSLQAQSVKSQVYTVRGSKGQDYVVSNSNGRWTCTCPGFQFRKNCRHPAEVTKN